MWIIEKIWNLHLRSRYTTILKNTQQSRFNRNTTPGSTNLSLSPLFVRTEPNWYILAVSTTSAISATWTHRQSNMLCEKVSSDWHKNYFNYSNTTENNILFIDVLASRRKPSSGLTSGTGIEMRGATNWATYGTSFYILSTGTGSQSWRKLPTWSRNVDKQYVIFGCIRVNNIVQHAVTMLSLMTRHLCELMLRPIMLIFLPLFIIQSVKRRLSLQHYSQHCAKLCVMCSVAKVGSGTITCRIAML